MFRMAKRTEHAIVQWVSGHTFGLGFVRLRDSERERLREAMERLGAEGGRTDLRQTAAVVHGLPKSFTCTAAK